MSATAKDIVKALDGYYPDTRWNQFIKIAELRVGTGFGSGADQRIDYWVMDCWPSRGWERTAIEIKVSRSDFLHELKQPKKRRAAMLYSNRFYFCAPKDMVRLYELPPECGLLEYQNGKVKMTHEAPWRDGMFPTWGFVGSLVRRFQKERQDADSQHANVDEGVRGGILQDGGSHL